MKPNPYQLIESALEPGETLLWTGHQHGRGMRSISFLFELAFFLGLFGIPVTVLCEKIWRSEFEFGLVFLLLPAFIGGYALINTIIVEPLACSRTCYGITERHALIASGGQQPGIRTVWLGNIESIEIRPNGDGHGSIKCYAPLEPPFGKMNNKGEKRLKPLFRGVADVRAVRDLLEQEINIQRATRVRDDDGISHWVRSDVSGR